MTKINEIITEIQSIQKWDDAEMEKHPLENIVIGHAILAGMAGMAAGILPGIGAIFTLLSSAGIVGKMVLELSSSLNIPFGKNLLSAISEKVTKTVIKRLGGMLIGAVIVSTVPGIAFLSAAVAAYGVTYLAGVVFLNMILNLYRKGQSAENMTMDELHSQIRRSCAELKCKQIYQAAAEDAKEKIKNGEIRMNAETPAAE